MGFSEWLKFDLHIHSIASNISSDNPCGKINDCTVDYDADKLITVMAENSINILSITDHNTINEVLYLDLIEKRDLSLERKINFIVGCELDIIDDAISTERFHCLIFFDSDNLDSSLLKKYIKIIDEIVDKYETDDKRNFPNLHKIIDTFRKNEERNFILIPHFKGKGRGIMSQLKHDSPIFSYLNTGVFDAYEDSNNIKNFVKSYKIYDKASCSDLPIFIFSDCHNINVYPKYKSETDSNVDFLHLLGNIEYPFNSLKLSLHDVHLRIGSDREDLFRHVKPKNNYIEEINIDDNILKLSPYQNTIIGGFGSGKSFLQNIILYGLNFKDANTSIRNQLRKKYTKLSDKISKFEIKISDTTNVNSLSELKNSGYKLLIFRQNEDIFHKTEIDENYRLELEENLTIEFPTIDDHVFYNIDSLKDYLNDFEKIFEKSITDIINYKILYKNKLKINRINNLDLENLLKNKTNDFEVDNALLNYLDKEKIKKFYTQDIYIDSEKSSINGVIENITSKNEKYRLLVKKHNVFLHEIEKMINDFNAQNNEEPQHAQQELKKGIFDYISNFIKKIKILKKELDLFEEKISRNEFDKYHIKKIKESDGYSLETKYIAEKEYVDWRDEIFIKELRKYTLFKNYLSTMYKKVDFHRTKPFYYNLDNYYSKYFIQNFKNRTYNISVNNQSILEMSAGERASSLIVLMFKLLEENSNNKNIVIIDQPEDNLDNKSIYDKVVKEIIEMKKKNIMVQFIFVSHNPNITISSDSENIIIAKKDNNVCMYEHSGIEDKEFSKKICMILEGGMEALQKRGIKFSISSLKEFKEGN